MDEPREREFVRQPDFSRGEKAMYTLEEVIGFVEDARACENVLRRRDERIVALEGEIQALALIASRCLDGQPKADPLEALRDVVSRANRGLR